SSDQASFYNCLFTSNSIAGSADSFGGAIDAYHSAARIYNCSFYANRANLNVGFARGGGALDFRGAGLPLIVENSIFWHNTAPNPTLATLERQQINISGGGQTISSSLIEGLAQFGGSSNIGDDPYFVDAEAGN